MQFQPLVLEVNAGADFTPAQLGLLGGGLMMTPAVGDESFWLFRVKLSDTQAIVGFPKFTTIGIGFAKEEDWNTNLPFRCSAKEIFDHIGHNKGDDSIADARCIEAIEMVRVAAAKLKGEAR